MSFVAFAETHIASILFERVKKTGSTGPNTQNFKGRNTHCDFKKHFDGKMGSWFPDALGTNSRVVSKFVN